MPHTLLKSLALLAAATLTLPAVAEVSVQRYFRELKSLDADFAQTVIDANGRVAQNSAGHMLMEKPGRFRWDYASPGEQTIVADGRRLWLYDPGLEQVTVRKLDDALGATPLALLSGAAPIDQAFRVGAAVERDGLVWFELTPKQMQGDFRVLRVAFRAEELAAIEFEDAFGQRTRIDFRTLKRNGPVDADKLRFTPPRGVDVIGEAP